MGMFRKTLSIGTLGLVSFRSKNERLARADEALAHAEARADLVTLELAETRRSSRRRRRAKESRTLLAKSAGAVEEIGHAVAQQTPHLADVVRDGADAARDGAHAARERAESVAETVKDRAETLKDNVKDSAKDRAATAKDTVKDRAGTVKDRVSSHT